jgi:hypothetical protein
MTQNYLFLQKNEMHTNIAKTYNAKNFQTIVLWKKENRRNYTK